MFGFVKWLPYLLLSKLLLFLGHAKPFLHTNLNVKGLNPLCAQLYVHTPLAIFSVEPRSCDCTWADSSIPSTISLWNDVGTWDTKCPSDGQNLQQGWVFHFTLKMGLFLLMDYWLPVPNSLDILPKMQVIRALSKRWCLASPSEQRRDVDPRSLQGGMGLELDDGCITSSHGLEDGSVHKL